MDVDAAPEPITIPPPHPRLFALARLRKSRLGIDELSQKHVADHPRVGACAKSAGSGGKGITGDEREIEIGEIISKLWKIDRHRAADTETLDGHRETQTHRRSCFV